MKKLIKFLYIVFLLGSLPIVAQNYGTLDTLLFSDLKSNSLIITTTKEILYKELGIPERIGYDYKTIFFLNTGKRQQDTVLSFNIFDYYKSRGIAYIEKDNRVRISAIDFYIQDTIKILHPKVVLCRTLTISKLKEIFPYSAQSETVIQTDFLPYKLIKKKEKGISFIFYSSLIHDTLIELYFDESGKLRYLDIDREDW